MAWRDLGRSLVVATTLDLDEVPAWGDTPDVVAIQLEGEPVDLARRRALAPDLVDVVLLDATGEGRGEAIELARVCRSRGCGVVLAVTDTRWGREASREFLTVSRERMAADDRFWNVLDAAARWTRWSR